MLNIEQILIKTAQYFDLDLKKLGIKESSIKTRLFKRHLEKETIEHIVKKIYQEIESLDINNDLKGIVKEFFEHYSYISEQLYISFDETKEKELDWLLLKYFVIPFFAVRVSQNFSLYDDRIDYGLPGGDFWYLPTYMNESKISFPINKVMKWLIDLYGGTNQDFYYNKTSDYDNGFSPNTLKKWHNHLTIPEIKTIKEFTSHELVYSGLFSYDKEASIALQYKTAIEFIELKSISIEQLKLEVPNTNNILDRLYSETLTDEERARFVLYVEQRWSKPTLKKIEYLLTASRVSQACYKELCKYFDTNEKTTSIDDNKIMQLSILFEQIYNTTVSLQTGNLYELTELFESYIYFISKIESNPKEALDEIIASIYTDLELNADDLVIDEVLVITSIKNREKSIKNLAKKENIKLIKEKQNKQVYDAIKFIQTTNNEEKIIDYICSISDSFVLHNIGDYFQGNNYLTNELVEPDLRWALTIHIAYSRIAQDSLNMQNAYHKVLNLLTFSYYPRALNKEDVEEWLFELERITDKNDTRSILLIMSYKIYHLINQKNVNDTIIMIEEFTSITMSMKPEEYSPQALFVAQDYMLTIGNQKSYKKLKKINEKHPRYKEHHALSFHFYK